MLRKEMHCCRWVKRGLFITKGVVCTDTDSFFWRTLFFFFNRAGLVSFPLGTNKTNKGLNDLSEAAVSSGSARTEVRSLDPLLPITEPSDAHMGRRSPFALWTTSHSKKWWRELSQCDSHTPLTGFYSRLIKAEIGKFCTTQFCTSI